MSLSFDQLGLQNADVLISALHDAVLEFGSSYDGAGSAG